MTTFNVLHQKISESLKIKSNKSDKNYWWAYITALLDYNIISLDEYQCLRDFILIYKRE